MPEICIVFDAVQLSAPFHQFHERCRLECGFRDLQPELQPNIMIKAPFTVPKGHDQPLARAIESFVQKHSVLPAIVELDVPSAGTIQEASKTTLRFPVRSERLIFQRNLLQEYLESCNYAKSEEEGAKPQILLVPQFEPDQKNSLRAIAKSMKWPRSITLGAIVIYRKTEGKWESFLRISRPGA